MRNIKYPELITGADNGMREQAGQQRRRYGGLTRLAAAAPGLGDKALRRRGFTESRIVSDWPAIAGAALAADTAPEKLVFPRGKTGGGTLHLRVAGAAALEVQHRIPQLIERINTVFGYGAITRIMIRQGPLPQRPHSARPRLRPLAPPEEEHLRDSVAGIGRAELREALEGLGRAVTARTAGPSTGPSLGQPAKPPAAISAPVKKITGP